MSSTVFDLPFECLRRITDRLDESDLLKLRLLNKKTARVIEALPNWKEIILERWLEYEDGIQADIDGPFDFKYYSRRCKNDSITLTMLRRIQSLPLTDEEI